MRRCLLPGSIENIRSSSSDIIAQVDAVLQANERSVLAPGLRGEALKLREAAASMRKQFTEYAKPYLHVSTELALGNIDGVEKLRKPVADLSVLEAVDSKGEDEETIISLAEKMHQSADESRK